MVSFCLIVINRYPYVLHWSLKTIFFVMQLYPELERQREALTPVPMDSSSCNTSLYFTPMASKNNSSESYFSTTVGVGPHSYERQNNPGWDLSGKEYESGISMSDSSCGEDIKHMSLSPSWLSESQVDGYSSTSTQDTIAFGNTGTKSKNTLLSMESETDNSANVTLDDGPLISSVLTRKEPRAMPAQIHLFCGNGIISRAPVHSVSKLQEQDNNT